MRIALSSLALALALAAPACECATSHERRPDATPAVDAPARTDVRVVRDAPRAIMPDAPPLPPGTLGARCDAGRCDAGLTCGSDVVVTILELDGGTHTLVVADGLCTRRCAFDGSDGCDHGSRCAGSVPLGAGRVSVVDESGHGLCVALEFADARLWYDLSGMPGPTVTPCSARDDERPCTLGCRTDADCAYEPVSVEPLVFAERAPTVALTCDHAIGTCRHFSSTGPVIGTACTNDLGCAAAHYCWGGPDWSTPGVCIAFGCAVCTGLGVACTTLEPGGLEGCAPDGT